MADQFSVSLSFVAKLLRRPAPVWPGLGPPPRLLAPKPLHGGPNVTLVATLTLNGLQAAMTVSGAVNGDVFAAYLDRVLGPTLVPGDVVVLDNLPAHKVAGLAEIVAARGAGFFLSHFTTQTISPMSYTVAQIVAALLTKAECDRFTVSCPTTNPRPSTCAWA